jgi:hypothetical protein
MSERLVVFDAPDELKHAFLASGFTPHGRQPGAWSLEIERGSILARDLEYEMTAVGPRPRWWTPAR